MVKETALYDILEVKPTATKEEITKNGKKLAVKSHPDKHPNNVEMATKKFQDIQEALSILSNDDKRQIYDNYGMDGLKGMGGDNDEGFNPFGGGGFPFGGGGFPFGGFQFGGDMFGNMANNRGQERENIMKKIDVTLEQIYKEETVNLKYEQKITCNKCNGEGTNDGNKVDCNDCNGKGVRMRTIKMGPMIQQSVAPCTTCNSKGKIVPEHNKCSACTGKCFIMKEKTVQISLKNGFGSGIKMQLEGKGNQINNIKTDLVVVINELEHPIFKRRHSDLIVEIKLKLYQALFGFDKIIEHLDGRKLHIHHTGKTNYGTIRKIQGEGLVDLRTKQKGDLVIKFTFDLPSIKNETLQKALMLIDKPESTIEKEIQNQTDLVKTIMMDVSDAENHMKDYTKKNQSDEKDSDDREGGGGGVQCPQQ